MNPSRLLLVTLVLLGLSGCAMNPPPVPDRASYHPEIATSAEAAGERLADGEPLTLDSAVALSLLNNPQLRADFIRFEAMLLDVPQESSLPDPMAMVGQQEAFRGPGNERENMITISQTFPWFDKRGLRGRVARAEALEALEEYRAGALEVRREVIRTWHNLRYEEASRELAQRDRDLIRETVEATTSQYSFGRADRSTLLRAQSELARLESELPRIDANIVSLRRQLERLTGEEGLAERPLSTDPMEPSDLPPLAVLLAEASEHRPELQRYLHQEEAGKLSSELSRKDYYPDFTVGVGVVAMGDRGGEFYSPTSDERTDSWQASVGINIPIPNSRRRAATEQARKRVEEANLRHESASDSIIEQIHATTAQLHAIERERATYVVTVVALAEEAYEAAESAYRVGRANYSDLIDTQRSLITARREALRVERDQLLAIADLERAVGMPLHLIPTDEEPRP